jgi:hypothetical protein
LFVSKRCGVRNLSVRLLPGLNLDWEAGFPCQDSVYIILSSAVRLVASNLPIAHDNTWAWNTSKMIIGRWIPKRLGTYLSEATSSTTDPIWSALGLNQNCLSDWPVTNRLNFPTAPDYDLHNFLKSSDQNTWGVSLFVLRYISSNTITNERPFLSLFCHPTIEKQYTVEWYTYSVHTSLLYCSILLHIAY